MFVFPADRRAAEVAETSQSILAGMGKELGQGLGLLSCALLEPCISRVSRLPNETELARKFHKGRNRSRIIWPT